MFFGRSSRRLETSFRTPDLGNLVLMRLTAFVQDQDAEIVDVQPDRAVMRIGGPTMGDRLFGRPFRPRVQVELNFVDVPASDRRSWNRETEVQVLVTPRQWRQRQFDQMAKVVCAQLRGFFAAV